MDTASRGYILQWVNTEIAEIEAEKLRNGTPLDASMFARSHALKQVRTLLERKEPTTDSGACVAVYQVSDAGEATRCELRAGHSGLCGNLAR